MTRPDQSTRLFADTDHATELRGERRHIRPRLPEVRVWQAAADDALNAWYAAKARRNRLDRICIAIGLFALAWFVAQLVRAL